MSYSKSVFKKATQVIETRHNEAVRKSEEKHSQCILLFPEIAEYEKEKEELLPLYKDSSWR